MNPRELLEKIKEVLREQNNKEPTEEDLAQIIIGISLLL